jgi:photosystem II stability/assembly factor-like uncharacterized protein
MKNFFTLSILFVSILFSCVDSDHYSEEEMSFKERYPHDFMFMQRAYPTGEIKTDAYANAIRWKKQFAQRNQNQLPWEFSGPVNVGGRITDIEIPIDQAQTYYVGAASGGIFKTTDAGANWIPIFDDQEMLSIGDMEISKNNTGLIWVGTGEVNAGGGSLAYDGDGIYKSVDGGMTWETKGLPDVGSIGKVLIDPNDDETIFVGAMGPLFRNDNNRGVYRSINDGNTWEQVLFVSDSTGIIDMAIHPSNGDIVYAASWERIRRPNNRQYGGETSRIYRTTDGGDNWTELTNGLPSIPSEKGRISIDISQSNPNVLYASYAEATGSMEGIFKTTNGGDTWTEVNSSDIGDVPYEWWFGGLFVDPTDENTLFYTGFTNFKSTNGGSSWSDTFPGVHVDQHAMAFNASVTNEILLGNDGGLYKSSNSGVSSVKDNTLPITQFYRFYVDYQNSGKVYGGSQDNSTMRTTNGGLDNWNIITGGDGFQPLVDPTNTNVIYALSQRGNLVKSTNDGSSFFSAMTGISGSDPKNWDTPIAFDPANPQILFYGANRMYKTTNAAGNWSPISSDLSNGPHTGNLAFGTLTSISVSTFDSDVIYGGTDDGNVWVTQDGGSNWDLISASLPDRWVTRVKADPLNSNGVFVTLSGYRYGEDDGHIYYSDDLGSSWTDITNDLPDIPVNDIEVTELEGILIATDIGVFRINDLADNTWEPFGENMPSVVVTDLFMNNYQSAYIYAATYGRSSYKMMINILGVDDFDLNKVSMYPNPASDHVNISFPEGNFKGTIHLYDQLGKEVLIEKLSDESNEIRVSLNGVTTGLYFLKFESGNSKVTKKLLVK